MMADTTTSPGRLPRLCTAQLPVADLLDILLDSRATLDRLPSYWLQDLFVSDSAVSEIIDAVEWELSQIVSLRTNRWGLLGPWRNGEDVMGRLESRSMTAVRVCNISMPTKRSNIIRWGRETFWSCVLAPVLRLLSLELISRQTEIESVNKWVQSLEDILTQLLTGEDIQRKERDEEGRLVHAVAVYAVAVLASVYSYLVGVIGSGGTKSFSPGSPLFSSTFVSIVLVLAFYVWFKSRPAPRSSSRERSGYVRPGHTKIEAKYRPPNSNGSISLGFCATHEEAGIMKEMAAYYFDKHDPNFRIKDHEVRFEIPETCKWPDELRRMTQSKEKERLVKTQVKDLYKRFEEFTAGLPNPPVQQVEHDPSIAFEPASAVWGMVYREDFPASQVDSPGFLGLPNSPGFLGLPNSPALSGFLVVPEVPDAEIQLVHDMLILEPIMSDNLGGGYIDIQPETGTSWDSDVVNAANGISYDVGVGVSANGGAAHDIPQSNLLEVQLPSRPSGQSPTNLEFFQQPLVPMTGLPNVDEPLVVHHLRQPQNTTLDPQQELQHERSVESYLQQRCEELVRENGEFQRENKHLRSSVSYFQQGCLDKDRLNEELARMLGEFQLDNERLRSTLQHYAHV